MRHRDYTKNLARTTSHMMSMRRNLASSLLQHGKITTTFQKAKDVQRFVERLITLARKNTLHARRQVLSRLHDRIMVAGHDPKEDPNVKLNSREQVVGGPTVVQKLFNEIAPSYADRSGGYTRIVRLARRRIGDGGQRVVLQLVDPKEAPRTKSTAVTTRKRRARARYAMADKVAKASSPAPSADATPPQADEPAAEQQPQADAPATDGPAEEKSE
ncbi:MAG: 50S ribosomal protein L17 [Phycisphaerae bacterium]|nr:50S ribosomal protein L17 [Phycisphaerae bacterium]